MVAIGQTVGSVINTQLLPGNRNWMHLFNGLLSASTYNTNRFLVQVLAPSREMALRGALFIESHWRVEVYDETIPTDHSWTVGENDTLTCRGLHCRWLASCGMGFYGKPKQEHEILTDVPRWRGVRELFKCNNV